MGISASEHVFFVSGACHCGRDMLRVSDMSSVIGGTRPEATKMLKSADTGPIAGSRAHPPPLPPLGSGGHRRGPASRSARDLFDQAAHELAEAVTSSHPHDRHCRAHMAALHAPAAAGAARAVPAAPTPRRPRPVRDLLYREA